VRTAGEKNDIVLTVKGHVTRDLALSRADLSHFPRASIRAKDELGRESLFEGVLLVEILRTAGVKFGKELRGKRLAEYLLVETEDGYRGSSRCRSSIRLSGIARFSWPIAATANRLRGQTAGYG